MKPRKELAPFHNERLINKAFVAEKIVKCVVLIAVLMSCGIYNGGLVESAVHF